MKTVTPTQLRKNIYNLLDEVLDTGIPIEIKKGDRKLRIVPEEKMGDVMTDLQGRRSIILGMEGEGVYQKIKAKVPLADLNKYSTALSSLTNGRGTYSMKFDGYEKVPPEIQQQLLKDYEASQEEE